MTALAWIVGGGTLWAVGSTVVALVLGAVIGRSQPDPEPPPLPPIRRRASPPRSLRHLPCAAGRTLSRG